MKRLDQLVFSHWKQLKVWGGTRRGLQLPPMLPRMTLMSRVEKCVSDASTKNLVLHRKKMTTKLLLLNISQDSFYYAQFISYYIPRRTIKVLLRRKVSTKACCFFHTFYDLLIRVVFKTCCPQKWIEITTLRKKKKIIIISFFFIQFMNDAAAPVVMHKRFAFRKRLNTCWKTWPLLSRKCKTTVNKKKDKWIQCNFVRWCHKTVDIFTTYLKKWIMQNILHMIMPIFTKFSWKHANYRWKLFNKKSAKNLDKTHVYILRRQTNLWEEVGAISVQDLY